MKIIYEDDKDATPVRDLNPASLSLSTQIKLTISLHL